MKTEQEQRRAIRQILFDANEICQAIPCENELCMYYGDYRCYDNVIVDKLIRAGYGDVSEYKAEIERLRQEVRDTDKMARNTIEQYRAENKELENALKQSEDNYSRAFERLKAQQREIEQLKDDYAKLQEQFVKYQTASDKEILAQVKQAKIDVLNELKEKCKFDGHTVAVYKNDIDEMIEEIENE